MGSSNYRSRKHVFLLYPDNPDHVSALEKIKSTYDHIYILHDKDVYTDGDNKGQIKKSHWHVVVEVKNAVWSHALCKSLDLPVNYVQQVRNEEAALAYLIHFNEPEKTQYPLTEVRGSNRSVKKLQKIIENHDMSECEKVFEMLDVIDTSSVPISVMSYAKFCAAAERWDVFRRSAGIFLKLIEEKNKSLQSS